MDESAYHQALHTQIRPIAGLPMCTFNENTSTQRVVLEPDNTKLAGADDQLPTLYPFCGDVPQETNVVCRKTT